MRIFFSAGEASGDAYAAALAREFRKSGSDDRFEGVGGPSLAAEGAEIVADSRSWGAIGILQALRKVPAAVLGYRRALRALRRGAPGLLIPIDFGYFNIRLARRARAMGWKVLYFVPPGSWRRDRQGRDLPNVADAIVCPFPWSAEILRGMGANARFFGHPLGQLIGPLPETPRQGIAVLPGSRDSEILENLWAIAEAIRGLDEPVCLAAAPNVDGNALLANWRRLSGRDGDTWSRPASAVLGRARAAIVCSGTATLEAALCGTPSVVMYRVSRTAEMEAKILRIRPKFIALPNVLLDRAAVPELIQHAATPEGLRAAILPLLNDGPERAAQLKAFEEIAELCGPRDAIVQTARWARELFDG